MVVNILDMKKFLIFVVFIFAIVSVAVVSAETAKVDMNITLDGIQFNIPEGYAAVDQDRDVSNAGDTEDIDGTQVDTETSAEFKNAAGDELELKVGSRANQKIDSINSNGEKKNISGKDGYLSKEMDDGKEKYKFEYLQDGKIVKITAVSEDIISKVIV